jgi:F-type H+-transporting ATPase subunit f
MLPANCPQTARPSHPSASIRSCCTLCFVVETQTNPSREYLTRSQGLGAAANAVRMAKIAKFYEKLPKGHAPERASSGPLGWYQAKYFGKNPSAARECSPGELEATKADLRRIAIWHVIFGIMTMGYSMEYYFHLSTFSPRSLVLAFMETDHNLGHHKNNAH